MSGLTSDYGTIQLYGTSANQPATERVFIVTDDNYVQTEISGSSFELIGGDLVVYCDGNVRRGAAWADGRWTSIVEKVKDE